MTGLPLVVRRCDLIMDIGLDAESPGLPFEVVSLLAPLLVYDHQRFLRGAEMYAENGPPRRVEITRRRLYDISPEGRLQTGFGFLPTLLTVLGRAGHQVRCLDISPERTRLNCYESDWTSVQSAVTEWRPRQLECLQTMERAYGGIIKAPPAFGKTEMIGRFCLLYPHAKIAVVTKRRDVARSIQARLCKLVPNVGFVGDGERKKKRVTVFIAKSMHRADPDTDIVLLDEPHELMSDDFSGKILRTFVSARLFGLTATPTGRSDGTDIRLTYLCGPVIFEMSWQEATELGLVVPVEVRWINVQMDYNPTESYSSDVSKKRHGIWRNTVRNQAIAAAARSHTDDEQVLILVETIEHAVHLGRFLSEFALCYGSMDANDLDQYRRDGSLPSDYQAVTPQQREAMRQAFEKGDLKKVIATDVWSTGVSFEQLAVLIRADGRSSEIMDEQAPGRVVRTHAGKSVGVVYDCYDMFDANYKRKSQERWRRYAKKGWTQKRKRVLDDH